jgi:hypothetical protein
MKAITVIAVSGLIAASTTLTGCVVALGNRVPPGKEGKATLGKELTDLKQARDAGAMSEEEYQSARERLIEGK